MNATIDETEEARRGALLAEVLKLRKSREFKDRWETTWGTKTALGLYRAALRIVEDGE